MVLELILNGIAPRAMLLRQPDAILALGVIVAQELFGKSIPLVSLGAEVILSRLCDLRTLLNCAG